MRKRGKYNELDHIIWLVIISFSCFDKCTFALKSYIINMQLINLFCNYVVDGSIPLYGILAKYVLPLPQVDQSLLSGIWCYGNCVDAHQGDCFRS